MRKSYSAPTIELLNFLSCPLLQASKKGEDYKSGDVVLSPGHHDPYYDEEEEEDEEEW